jgi:hypothetical protein
MKNTDDTGERGRRDDDGFGFGGDDDDAPRPRRDREARPPREEAAPAASSESAE